ncbi:cupin domain-containing protein [Corallincola platygyrae]|uniref:Cupin domain-containing protein n=1 Tax=Corallincola platygyrae TaxID=1193278 RepID=A0ABW4XKI0_9GAMM
MISKENAQHYQWGDQCDGWHLAKTERLSVIQELVPPGKAETRHYHRQAEQFFFVLSGTATLEVSSTLFELQAQQGKHVPANTPHQLSNLGTEPLNFLVVSTPPSHGDRVEHLDE